MGTTAGWLKKASVDLNKPKESIIDALKKNTGKFETGRSRTTLHASDITKPDFCPRNEAFLDMQGVTHGKGQFIPPALRVTFDMGSATERMIVERWGGDAVYGNWRCSKCKECRTFCTKPAINCKSDHICDWKYQQWAAISQEYAVSGAVDSLWSLGTPKLMMAEIKTMAPSEFELIVGPLPEHRLRTNLYLKLIADSASPYKDKINLHEARVLYTSRAYGKKNDQHGGEILPWREFIVKRDDKALEPILNKAKQLKIFRETKAIPSGICPTAMSKTAQKCSNCQLCFSGQFPAQQPSLL